MNANRAIPAVPRGAWRKRVWKNRMMYLMLLIPLAMLILFKYVPMYGVQIAFRNFLPGPNAPHIYAGILHIRLLPQHQRLVGVGRNHRGLNIIGNKIGGTFPNPIRLAGLDALKLPLDLFQKHANGLVLPLYGECPGISLRHGLGAVLPCSRGVRST